MIKLNKKDMFNYLSDEQIEKKRDFIKYYVGQKNNATASLVDPNSNVTDKNTGTLLSEMYKFESIQISRKIIKDELEELFDKGTAEQYEKDIDDHLIYVHDETLAAFVPYCASVTMYPFLLGGTKVLGGTSRAPTNLQSFCGSFVNLVYQLATNWAGATATVEFLMYFDYFARKQYGKDYLKTNAAEIGQELQGVVYALNQPAAARGNQSVFWNISVFDKFYFNSIFGGFVFPDGTPPEYNSIAELQKFFMDWFRKERKKELLTYPVLTAAILLGEDNKPLDKDFADFIATEMSLGLSFFLYESHSADSLASCCFDGWQKVLVKSGDRTRLLPIKDCENLQDIELLHNGKWCGGKFVKTRPSGKLYKIKTGMGDSMICTEDHIWPVAGGDKQTKDLTTDDFLKNSAIPLEGEGGEGYIGFVAGIKFSGAGYWSEYGKKGFSVSVKIKENVYKFFAPYFGKLDHSYNRNKEQVMIRFSDKEAEVYEDYFPEYWVPGELEDLSICNKSMAFRRGFIEGASLFRYDSFNMCKFLYQGQVDYFRAVLTSMGLQSSVLTDYPTIKVGDDNFVSSVPEYTVKWSSTAFIESPNDYAYIPITAIYEVPLSKEVYCFEMEEEPYFTLPNGIITHNCRLRNELADNTFSYTLGAGGVSTGSFRVITINMNRYTQKYEKELPFKELVQRIHKYLVAHREVVKWYIDSGMLPAYNAGFISLGTQFGTVGINGMLEAMEAKGYSAVRDPEAYSKEVGNYLKVIYDTNKEDRLTYGFRFNTEFVPKHCGDLVA